VQISAIQWPYQFKITYAYAYVGVHVLYQSTGRLAIGIGRVLSYYNGLGFLIRVFFLIAFTHMIETVNTIFLIGCMPG
jgi:hypothetical protein